MRAQRVVVENHCSEWSAISSGVPQGSLLGPLLFNIYINDLPSACCHSSTLLYADDAKFYKSVTSLSDCNELQTDISNCHLWCLRWKLMLNLTKCNVISFSSKKTIIKYDYLINNSPLTRVDKVNDLGVLFKSNFSFKEHINNIVNKSFRILGFIKRNSKNFTD
jgi:hypothetical protein